MYSIKHIITHNKIFIFLIFLSILFLNTEITHAQNSDSLIQIINYSKSVEKINDAKGKLPEHLAKVDMIILDVVIQLKAEGTNRTNAAKKSIHKRFSNNNLQIDDNGNILADVYMDQVDSKSIEWLKEKGILVEYVDKNFKRITCKVPFDMIESIANNNNINGISCIPVTITEVGDYTTSGDGILNASNTRSTYSINGMGFKVGIISDGVDHRQDAINSDDLPAGFQVINNRISGDEGTAIAEIVHDIAPGASLAFSDHYYGEIGIANSITALRNANCNIIIDDVWYPLEPMFEDGTIADAIDQATANGVKYISSAGNYAEKTWTGQSVDNNSNSWMEFSGSTEVNSISVGPGETFQVVMQWANKWGDSNDDYDLYLYDGSSTASNVLKRSTRRQNGDDTPYEYFSWTNDNGSSVTVYLRVKFYSVSSPRVVKLMGHANGPYTGAFNYITDGGIKPHAAASSCISVGALNASSPQTIASYSSHGPSRIYSYDTNGNPVSYIERATPTICGIDGVQTYVGTSGIWSGGDPLFYGTSASAPHIAGIAALLLDQNGNLSWQETKGCFTQNATKVPGMGGQNFTNAYGYGRIDAYNSTTYLYVPEAFSSISEAINVSVSGQTVKVSGSQTLSSNITVPSGVTLTIASGATVNLGTYSIISTGGTINKESGATINGMRATLSANNNLRGLCGRIQTASNYAGSTNTIFLIDGNFNENVSVYNKTSLSIIGSSSYNHFGNLILSNCDYFYGVGFGAKSVFISEGDYTILANLNVDGIDQSTIGFTLYNSDASGYNLSAQYSQAGIHCYDGSEIDLEVSLSCHNLRGIDSYCGSNVNIENSYFCGTALDLKAYLFSSIEAYYCYYDGGIPSISSSSSTVYTYGNQSCPLYKVNPGQQMKNDNYVVSANDDNPEKSEFGKINSAYFDINKRLIDALNTKSAFNKDSYCNEYEKVIADFTEFIKNNPDSPLSKIAFMASARCYRRVDDLRGKSDAAGMKNFLTGIIEDKEYTALIPLAERRMIDYYKTVNDYTNAIIIADNLLEKYKSDDDYVCNILYVKGLTLLYDLNNSAQAEECFKTIIREYSDNPLVHLAANELKNLGYSDEQIETEKSIADKPNEFNISNNPNPFNPATTIYYSIPVDGKVSIKVYDSLGRLVKELVNETKAAGSYQTVFDGTSLASGVYYYKININGQVETRKMLLVK
ncbi:MAG: S8 family serine peptidase [Calditrichaceae bacterium]|nr:S8 family serine peptidase [Calditrichaceae bacterium]MBN2710710.1 S8 family serine peptidase [Calditrichaceae bacterium]RQV92739.1 MAG: T9SS C-terminal target domain-containing protein [Calditrichota bacterium]